MTSLTLSAGTSSIPPTLQLAKEYVGGDLVLSDFVVLEKTRADGTVMRRVILNCKTSGISAASLKARKYVYHVPLIVRTKQWTSCVPSTTSRWSILHPRHGG